MADRPDDWLVKKLIEENSLAFRTVWDLYLKFYTVFLTFSITALALTVQYVKHQNQRLPIVLVFVFQNLISAGTAYGVARFSYVSGKRFEAVCRQHLRQLTLSDAEADQLKALCESPMPGWLGVYGGVANMASHVSLIACWIAVL